MKDILILFSYRTIGLTSLFCLQGNWRTAKETDTLPRKLTHCQGNWHTAKETDTLPRKLTHCQGNWHTAKETDTLPRKLTHCQGNWHTAIYFCEKYSCTCFTCISVFSGWSKRWRFEYTAIEDSWHSCGASYSIQVCTLYTIQVNSIENDNPN